MYAKGLHPGATWRKCDFQIHTPRDPQWSGSAHLPGGTPELEKERHIWAGNFIAKCIAFGLKAIAITDHHDFCFVDYIQQAIQQLHKPEDAPWVFPGVEVTCDDAVQCLVLFDMGSNKGVWNRLFGGHLMTIMEPNSLVPTNPQAVTCGKNIEDFIAGIASDKLLNECSIVLPHASNDGAHKSMLRVGFQARFKQLPFDGIYTDKAYENLDEVTKKKIYGQILEWGQRRRGIIPTGDNRSQSFEKLGLNTCWIRLGEPTTEAIRQAVLADEARITYENPSLPNQRILELQVASSLTGPDFRVSFNDGFNALIGGRGSGKSAILEYLRFGLGRSASDIESVGEDGRNREQNLIADTLQNGRVVIRLERDGVAETWLRTAAERDVIEVTLPDNSTEKITIGTAQQRFRARAFYQKQLSTLVTDPRKAGEQITGIAAAESVDRLAKIEQEITGAKREVQAAFQRLVEFWAAEGYHNNSINTVADLHRRIEATRIRLNESGFSSESQNLLDAAPTFNLVNDLTNEAKNAITRDISSLQKSAADLPSIDPLRWEQANGFPEVVEFIGATAVAKIKISQSINEAIVALKSIETAQASLEEKFKLRHDDFTVKHQAAMTQQANLKTLIDESARLVADLQGAEATERRNSEKLKTLQNAPIELQNAREQLTTTLGTRRKVLETAAGLVQKMSADSLKAKVESETLPAQYLNVLVGICENNRVRELQNRCEDRVREILSPGSIETWGAVTDKLLGVYKHKLQTGNNKIEPRDAVSADLSDLTLKQLTPQQLSGIYSQLSDSQVTSMLTATPEDYISFTYNDVTGFIPFQQASPGQQAAALLHLLLNQEAGSLIVDQPEEDLDNKVIMKIVTLVQTTKRTRQLIFATHNSNFVVNGDADKVVVLAPGTTKPVQGNNVETPRISIDVDGAIETMAVRQGITETMEGGRAAFELRSRKYSFI